MSYLLLNKGCTRRLDLSDSCSRPGPAQRKRTAKVKIKREQVRQDSESLRSYFPLAILKSSLLLVPFPCPIVFKLIFNFKSDHNELRRGNYLFGKYVIKFYI